ncbi:MAG: hypothetical protein ACHREM_04195 [Polyangiales bacterium]
MNDDRTEVLMEEIDVLWAIPKGNASDIAVHRNSVTAWRVQIGTVIANGPTLDAALEALRNTLRMAVHQMAASDGQALAQKKTAFDVARAQHEKEVAELDRDLQRRTAALTAFDARLAPPVAPPKSDGP